MYVYIPFQGRLYYVPLAVDACFNYMLDATEIRHTCVSVTPVSLNIVILSVKCALRVIRAVPMNRESNELRLCSYL